MLALTATGLRDLGYTVIEARHRQRGAGAPQERAPVQLLLTDIVMPDLSGRKLAEQAVAVSPGLRVLFMTGFTKNAVVHNGVLDAGVHFLAKPFTLGVARLLAQACGRATRHPHQQRHRP